MKNRQSITDMGWTKDVVLRHHHQKFEKYSKNKKKKKKSNHMEEPRVQVVKKYMQRTRKNKESGLEAPSRWWPPVSSRE